MRFSSSRRSRPAPSFGRAPGSGRSSSSECGVAARIGSEAVRAGVLVGADGANGIVARTLGVDDTIVRGVALEGNIPLEALRADLERTAVIELAALPGDTAGSSRRATTRTSASAAGGARARGCATTSRASPARMASTPPR